MKYLSVCSGIEAASVAWRPLGWQAVAFAEIEKFPSAVLKHHHPNVPNLGDMRKYREWDIEPGTIDVLVGGTPCQTFSVAGLRAGLEDERGNLALIYCHLLQHFAPRWFVWENVPGVISSYSDAETCSPEAIDDANAETEEIWQSADFATLLAGFRECGYCVAGRILDAQYFGVPQRRRRIFVVGHSGDWTGPAEVLFEPGCLRGDTAKSRKSRTQIARAVTASTGGCSAKEQQLTFVDRANRPLNAITSGLTARPYGDRGAGDHLLIPFDTTQITNANNGSQPSDGDPCHTLSGHAHPPAIATSTGKISHCLNAGGMGRQDYETETLVVSSYRTSGDGCVYDEGQNTAPLTTQTDKCSTIIAIQERASSTSATSGPSGSGIRTDGKAFTLEARHHVQAVAFSGRFRGDDGRGYDRPPNVTGDIAGTLDTIKPGNVAGPSIGVRRLTPRECERLQGFPDDYTLIPYRKKMARDAPRYKAIGNSMAVPVMAWIGQRIAMVEDKLRNGELRNEK